MNAIFHANFVNNFRKSPLYKLHLFVLLQIGRNQIVDIISWNDLLVFKSLHLYSVFDTKYVVQELSKISTNT